MPCDDRQYGDAVFRHAPAILREKVSRFIETEAPPLAIPDASVLSALDANARRVFAH
jgi:hypothetical protein